MHKQHFRALQTKQKIENAFLILLKEYSFQQITINQIVEEANVGRSTFYSHYLDKYDLLEKMITNESEAFTKLFEHRFDNYGLDHFEEVVQHALKELSKKRTIIIALLDVETESVSLYNSFREILQKAFLEFIQQNKHALPENMPTEYIAELYAHTSMTTLIWQIRNGKNPTIICFAQELQQFLMNKYIVEGSIEKK